jgi:hypothetical protein
VTVELCGDPEDCFLVRKGRKERKERKGSEAESGALLRVLGALNKSSLRGAKRRGNPEKFSESKAWIASLRSQ